LLRQLVGATALTGRKKVSFEKVAVTPLSVTASIGVAS